MSKVTFLNFEQPIAELDSKIEELRFVQDDSAVDISEEIERFAERADDGEDDRTNQQERLDFRELAGAIAEDGFLGNRDPLSCPRGRGTAQIGHAVHVEDEASLLPADDLSVDPVYTGADPIAEQDATAIIDHDANLLGGSGGRGLHREIREAPDLQSQRQSAQDTHSPLHAGCGACACGERLAFRHQNPYVPRGARFAPL